LGLATFARRIVVRGIETLLVYADARDGAGLINTAWLPGIISQRSRIANNLVREIADAAHSLSQSDACPIFGNDTPPLPATPDSDGWLCCPNCDWRFNVNDRYDWTGERHIRCGQQLELVTRGA
jgi:hypothetical protein